MPVKKATVSLRIRRRAFVLPAIIVAAFSFLGFHQQATAQDAPAPDRSFSAALEADWMRQAELRFGGESAPGQAGVSIEEDAAGGVDGRITGLWGFHTRVEPNPWWRVDLGEQTEIDRVVFYNRCDSCGERNKTIKLLISNDDVNWELAWQNQGVMFLGHPDGKPLVAMLEGVNARYVRLALDGTQYLHLDEVQIYSESGEDAMNVALGRPATQSSVSQWSASHAPPAMELERLVAYDVIEAVTQRGLQLADELSFQDSAVDEVTIAASRSTLERILQQLASSEERTTDDASQELYLEAQRTVRRLALANPLLDFDRMLFVRRAAPMFPHMSDQFYCWWQRGGGSLCILEDIRSDAPRVVDLTPDWPDGTFMRPDVSYDGRRALFAYSRHYPELKDQRNKVDKSGMPEDAYFHLFEMNLETGESRQLTHGRYDDFDARYLPSGDIVFLSTRKGTFLQTGSEAARATFEADLPDSFVRCGGDNYRPVPVFTLHAINGDGGNPRQISAFENFEWTPSIANDGRIIYARWDYIDRFNGPFISLWSTNPDGTRAQLLYGNYTVKPQCAFEARAIPGSQKLVFTAAAHHSNMGGSLVLFDRTRGTEFERPLTRLTPEVCFPETEGWPEHYYANPLPLSETHFLVAWSNRKLPGHSRIEDETRNPSNALGLYLYDAFGNLTLLHRDPAISCSNPIPLRSRPLPERLPKLARWNGPQRGEFLVQNVYEGLDGVPHGSVKSIRIIGTPPKVQPFKNNPVLGVSAEEPGKYVLGTVPVEEDGSARFEVPSGVPYFFQALDADGLAVQTMRSMAYVQPGETVACVGCHESREVAPSPNGRPLASLRDPSPITPGPEGTWPLRFDRLVQPILNAQCVSCHSSDGDDPAAIALDLTPPKAYTTLMSFGGNDLKTHAFERDRSIVGETTARSSRLYSLLTAEDPHAEVVVSDQDMRSLIVWMDTYAHRVGSFSEEQEQELIEFRKGYEDLFTQLEIPLLE
jgi:hypothetical protein